MTDQEIIAAARAYLDTGQGVPPHSGRLLLHLAERAVRERDDLRGPLDLFLRIADEVAAGAAERWSRARKMQDAAALARAGKQSEAKALVTAADKTPTVVDFGRTVDDLAEAAKAARAIPAKQRTG
jgi:hypothetical protein